MNGFRLFGVFAGTLVAVGAWAHGPEVSRYRLTEIAPPASASSGCLPGYTDNATITTINDFGVVHGTVSCYITVDPAAGIADFRSSTFAAAPWFGAFELPKSVVGSNYAFNLNNRGELFGYEAPSEGGGLYGTRWTLAGGMERLFDDPGCETIRFSAAVDGNARYVVGWAFRPDPIFLPAVICISDRWMIRDAAGNVTEGPPGTPSSVNAFDMAVGISNRSAVRYQVRTGQLLVLHAADSTHSAEAAHINDLGEMAGRITTNSVPDLGTQCDPGVAVRWDRDGREQVLPHLPGATSSHAYAVGYEGETVGDSGAGMDCPYYENGLGRAVLWQGGRAFDLNSLIPRSAGITLTYAYSVNRRGQITAGGFDNDEPLTQCAHSAYDSGTQSYTVAVTPCHRKHMYVLTPVGR